MMTAAYLLLLVGALAGVVWVLMHVGSGWPSSMLEPRSGEKRFAILFAVACLLTSLGLLIAKAVS